MNYNFNKIPLLLYLSLYYITQTNFCIEWEVIILFKWNFQLTMHIIRERCNVSLIYRNMIHYTILLNIKYKILPFTCRYKFFRLDYILYTDRTFTTDSNYMKLMGILLHLSLHSLYLAEGFQASHKRQELSRGNNGNETRIVKNSIHFHLRMLCFTNEIVNNKFYLRYYELLNI